MIRTTQGHEKGIGLEVFLRSFFKLDLDHNNHVLYCYKNSLLHTLDLLNLPLQFEPGYLIEGKKKLKIEFVNSSKNSETMECILKALEDSKEGDIVHTLPSSKDQFELEGKQFKGHTDFLGEHFKIDASMCFLSPDSNFLLLTDHIALDEVFTSLSHQDLSKKIRSSMKGFPKDRTINRLYFSGINPHIGEEGVISKQDELIINLAKSMNMEATIHSGDTMHFQREDKNQLFIYCSHDQGLGVFKALYGLIGINFTANLPFRRVSVDHGTAFELFGKGEANCDGMEFLLSEIDSWK